MEYVDSHFKQLFAGFQEQFRDVVLVVDDKEFPCHKNILKVFSPYFKTLLTWRPSESQQQRIIVEDIEADFLEAMLNYMYTGNLLITESNVWDLLSTADFLQVSSVTDACCRFMRRHLSIGTCLQIYYYADKYSCHESKVASEEMIARYLNHIYPINFFLDDDQFVKLFDAAKLISDARQQMFNNIFERLNGEDKDKLQIDTVVKKLSTAQLKLPDIETSLSHLLTIYNLTNTRSLQQLFQKLKSYKPLVSIESSLVTFQDSKLIDGLVVVYGAEDDHKYCEVTCFTPPFHNQSITLSNLPFPLIQPKMVLAEQNMLYVYGINLTNRLSGHAWWRYDPYVGTWKEMTCPSIYRRSCDLAVCDGYIYAVGGVKCDKLLSSVERYDVLSDTWELMPPMGQALMGVSAIGLEDYLYVVGGFDNENCGTSRVQRFCPKTRTWSDVAPMGLRRFSCATAIYSKKLYVIGGWDAENDSCTNVIERYDALSNIWTSIGVIPEGRYNCDATVFKSDLYLLGGLNENFNYCTEVFCQKSFRGNWLSKLKTKNSDKGVCCETMQIILV